MKTSLPLSATHYELFPTTIEALRRTADLDMIETDLLRHRLEESRRKISAHLAELDKVLVEVRSLLARET